MYGKSNPQSPTKDPSSIIPKQIGSFVYINQVYCYNATDDY